MLPETDRRAAGAFLAPQPIPPQRTAQEHCTYQPLPGISRKSDQVARQLQIALNYCTDLPWRGSMPSSNRWGIAAAGILMQMALGAVYAWSVFRIPLVKQFHWSISQVTLTFTICVFVLGFAAFLGGLWLNKKGPRPVALTGGFLYGLGVFLASYSANNLHWLYFSY